MPPPLLSQRPRLRLGDQDRPELSAALQSCVLSQRSPRAAWRVEIDLLAALSTTRSRSRKRVTRGVGVPDVETETGGTTPTPEGIAPDPDWLEGLTRRGAGACALLLGDAVLFTGKIVSVTLRLPPGGSPVVRLTCRGTAPAEARSDAVLTLQHGSGLRWADLNFATASPARVRAQGTAEGAGLLRPGGSVDLTGLGPAFGGRYRLEAVSWRWDVNEGATSDFEARRLATPAR
jgi:hypothetical protein